MSEKLWKKKYQYSNPSTVWLSIVFNRSEINSFYISRYKWNNNPPFKFLFTKLSTSSSSTWGLFSFGPDKPLGHTDNPMGRTDKPMGRTDKPMGSQSVKVFSISGQVKTSLGTIVFSLKIVGLTKFVRKKMKSEEKNWSAKNLKIRQKKISTEKKFGWK